MKIRSKKGFTLVEIMIVVVIIGLLAAMAIPAFDKVRRNSVGKAMSNDARQIGGAMQTLALQYPLQTGEGGTLSTVNIVVAADGGVTSNFIVAPDTRDQVQSLVKKISRGYPAALTFNYNQPIGTQAFTLTHPQTSPQDVMPTSTVNVSTAKNVAVLFDDEGKAL